jgi:hypothetical protein
MSERVKQKPQGPEHPKGGSNRRDILFPPKLSRWEKVTLWIAYIALVLTSLYLFDRLCLKKLTDSWICCTYVSFGILLAILVIDRSLCHKLFVHKERLTDPSDVDALFVEAALRQEIITWLPERQARAGLQITLVGLHTE